jgi:hypothetical protein
MSTSISEINNYYQLLLSELESNVPGFEYNRDRCHNSTIFRLMLDKSHTIYMFCGELSVLREPFYEHITKDSSEEVSKKLANELRSSLSSFLEQDNAQLIIIFESYQESYLNDLICKEDFFSGVEQGKIRLYKLEDGLPFKNELDHFSLSDALIVRLEDDKEEHTAFCSINQDLIYNRAKDTFFRIRHIADPIKLPDNKVVNEIAEEVE